MWRQDVNPFGGHCFREGNPSAGELAASSHFCLSDTGFGAGSAADGCARPSNNPVTSVQACRVFAAFFDPGAETVFRSRCFRNCGFGDKKTLPAGLPAGSGLANCAVDQQL
jgi:hypothetical protein